MAGNSSKIPISGYGCITAVGADALAGYAGIESGDVCNGPYGGELFPADFTAPCFSVDSRLLEARLGGNPELSIESSTINRTLQLALAAILEALERADLSVAALQQRVVGIALGTTVGCTFHNEQYYQDWRDGKNPEETPLFTYLSSNIAQRIQQLLGVRGPRLTITNACASGTDAIGVAKNWIESGSCDIAIAGGSDELSRVACHGFKSLMLVSENSCSPFDKNRAGLNLGEGAGIVILESENSMSKKDRQAHGWVRGYGAGGDGYHPTAPHPDGRGLQLAVENAMQDGKIGFSDIGMINAHGTGTPANDQAETNALAALGLDSTAIPIVSTKGATGHTLGAAGGVEAVFTLLALNRGYVTGTIGCRERDPNFKCDILSELERAPLSSRIGISQSLAFGGGNSAVVIEGGGM